MVSLDHHSYTAMLARSSADRDDFGLYPEPPQGVFSSGPLDTMGSIPTDPYSGMFPASMAAAFEHHHQQQQQQHSPAFHHYGYAAQPSPGAFDDADLQIPASNVSSASAPSASSSAVGSPQSHHGQLGGGGSGPPAGGMHEWNSSSHHQHSHQGGLALTPGIVSSDFYAAMTGSDYSSYTHVVDDFAAFDFPSTGPKPPGYVGESRPVSATSRVSASSSASASSSSAAARLCIDTQLASTASSATRPSLSSPVSLASASFSSPPVPAWATSPRTPRVSSFFSQSSGHFVPPLQSLYPSLIHPEISGPMPMPGYDNVAFHHHARYPASPSTASSPQPVMRNASRSPYLHDGYQQPQQAQQQYSPFQPPMDGRRSSVHSFPSTASYEGNSAGYSGDETTKEKQRCPHPDCGKTFKDLKAHMLTHQNERPEKCPIQTCEYHVKGFARKYDKNRHTLTHYKGTMVCGFCPGSGSAAEKSFNRADVFKRHLTAVHGVEQTPPNSRKKAAAAAGAAAKGLAGYPPDATGKCSTCSQTFSNAQDFYEHLDDCVLRIVQQEDPAEAVNARLLGALENDKDVAQTMQRNNLPTQTQTAMQQDDEDEDMEDDDSAEEDDDESADRSLSPSKRHQKAGSKSRGLTHSRGGVPLRAKAKGRKNKTRKPGSWGYDKELVTLKKRVMCAFDGPRRLAKDDMMLSTEQEVRIKLSDGKSYTTDLDIYTVARAEGFHSATDEEKGLWVSDDPTEMQYRQMQDHAAMHVKPEHEFDAEVMA